MKWIFPILLPILVSSHYIKGISIYGLETNWRNFVCSWKNDVSVYIQKAVELGFNTLRLPYSYQYVQEGNFERMDHFFNEAYLRNLSVIPDLHRVWNEQQGPHPFENGVTMEQFINNWKTVCRRYINFPNFVGINAYNEYQGGDASFVSDYSARLFTAIEEEFPNRFQYWATGHTWAGNLSGVNLDYLPFKDRIGYSVHKYSWSGTADERDWNYSIPLYIDPERLIIGEFGWMENIPEQVDWAKRFIAYLKRRGIRHTCYWTIAHSHDTGNLYQDDCDIIKWENYNLLKTLWTDDQTYLRKG